MNANEIVMVVFALFLMLTGVASIMHDLMNGTFL
jgi:hypothetical protein